MQNKKSPIFFSVGLHSLLKLHIFLSGLYSYEQQPLLLEQLNMHLNKKHICR